MYQLKSLEDTIVAISTPTGAGGIGIVRLSGKESLSVADQLFVTKKKKIPSTFKNFTVHYGYVIDQKQHNDQIIDEALLTVMRSPKSYTCEDVVEISCHGGSVVLKTILHLAIEYGARLAEPGEFTKRAFLNGRIDLTQAEAVLDVIQSRTDAFLRVSTHQLKGELAGELESIREQLMNIYTELEAVVNFPEDDIDAKGKEKILNLIQAVRKRVEALLQSSEQGKILKEGIKIVLCGKPNVGKSSLLNVLLKQPRAIVSDIEGTTRDTIEETAQIKGVPFQLVDTAGILEPRDLIEEEAVKRSHMYMQSADLILLILDGSTKLSKEDQQLMEKVSKEEKDQNILIIVNKSDLPSQIDERTIQSILPDKDVVRISALKKKNIENLEERILNQVLHGRSMNVHGLLISNIRHIQSLKDCLSMIDKAIELFTQELSFEFISEEIKSAVNCLDSITGRNIDQDLLDKIFSEFCIGK